MTAAVALVLWCLSCLLYLEPPRTGQSYAPLACEVALGATDPLPYPWDTQHKTAALLMAVAWHESRFVVDAHSPPSDPVCSHGYWQTPCAEPANVEVAMRLLRHSLVTCGDLTEYVSGECGKAPQTAKAREVLALRLLDVFDGKTKPVARLRGMVRP